MQPTITTRPRSRRARPTALIAIALLLTGCAGPIRDVGHAAGEAAADGAVTQLKRQDTRQQFAELVGSPEVQHAGQQLGTGIGRAIIDELVSVKTGQTGAGEAGGRTKELNDKAGIKTPGAGPGGGPTSGPTSGPTTGPVSPGVASAVAKQTAGSALGLGGGGSFMDDMVGNAIKQGWAGVLSPESRENAKQLAEAMGDGAVHGAIVAIKRDGGLDKLAASVSDTRWGPAVNKVLAEQVRPMLRQFVHDDVAPAVVDILKESAANALQVAVRPDVSPAVVTNARNLSVGAGSASHDAVVQLGLILPDGRMTGKTKLVLWGLAGLGGLVALVALLALVVLVQVSLRLRRMGPAKA